MPGGFHNQARMTILSSGTGAFALGVAVLNFNTFANAGVVDQEVVPYGAIDTVTNNSEQGWGLYSSAGSSTAGPSLTRNVFQSTNLNAPIAFSASGTQVFIDPSAADLAHLTLFAHANLGGL